MFDKLKQINEIRQLQNTIKQERVEVEKQGVRVTMRGDFEIEHLTLNPELDTKTQEKMVMQCINEAKQKIQGILAKSFAGKLF